jgi:hypothetical protein
VECGVVSNFRWLDKTPRGGNHIATAPLPPANLRSGRRTSANCVIKIKSVMAYVGSIGHEDVKTDALRGLLAPTKKTGVTNARVQIL